MDNCDYTIIIAVLLTSVYILHGVKERSLHYL